MSTLTPAANDVRVSPAAPAGERIADAVKRLAAALDKALTSSASGARGM